MSDDYSVSGTIAKLNSDGEFVLSDRLSEGELSVQPSPDPNIHLPITEEAREALDKELARSEEAAKQVLPVGDDESGPQPASQAEFIPEVERAPVEELLNGVPESNPETPENSTDDVTPTPDAPAEENETPEVSADDLEAPGPSTVPA